MKKKSVKGKVNKTISRMEEKSRERHRRQEEEYGRDEFLFGAEDYEDEEENFEEDDYEFEGDNSDYFEDDEFEGDEFEDNEYDSYELDNRTPEDLPEFDEDDPDFFTRDVPKTEIDEIKEAVSYYEEDSFDDDFEELYDEEQSLNQYADDDDDDYDFLGEALALTAHERKTKSRKKSGFFGNITAFLTNMSMADRLIVATGVCVLIIAIVSGTIFANTRTLQAQVDSFADVGTDYAGIEIVGESGLTACIDARANYLSSKDVEEIIVEEEPAEEEVEEESTDGQVVMKASSIQSDLKIKFSDKESGKLLTGVVFSIVVKGDNGKEYEWSDENKDGLIYHTEVPNGTYSIEMKDLQGAEAEKYLTADKVTGVTVTDKIAYKKVDVADEIKKESEVNAAAEDTGVQDTQVESTLTDTVEWVESTKELISGSEDGYKPIDISDIVSPTETSSAISYSWSLPYMAAEADTPGDGESVENGQSISISISSSSVSLNVGESVSLGTTVTGTENKTVTWESSDSSVASVSDGNVEALKAGTATISVISTEDTSVKATCTITVSAKEEKTEPEKKEEGSKGGITISISKSSVTLKKGESESISATVENASDSSVEWASGDAGIATVSNGKITAVSAGSTVIMVWSKEDTSKTAKCSVTVTDADGKTEKINSDAKLLSKSGKQIYYKDSNGKYVEATAADYNTNKKFFVKSDEGNAVYKYTGWQTIDGNTYFFDKNGNYVTGDQVIQGAKYSFDSNGHLSTGSGTMGIDVSKWNGNIDWKAVKNSGVSYVIIRCGYRGSSTGALIEDPKFRTNISGAKAAGLAVGAYFFTQATNEVEAVEEASMAINLCSSYGLNLPLFLDVEGSGGRGDKIDTATRTAVCKAFCQTVQNSGFSSGIYANKTWLGSKINASALTSYKIWLAQYAASRTYSATRVDYWQYTSKGKVSGINGNVDLNIRY